jgi:hypothetical protein
MGKINGGAARRVGFSYVLSGWYEMRVIAKKRRHEWRLYSKAGRATKQSPSYPRHPPVRVVSGLHS